MCDLDRCAVDVILVKRKKKKWSHHRVTEGDQRNQRHFLVWCFVQTVDPTKTDGRPHSLWVAFVVI